MTDRYTKAVLTVIAICLTWLCVRDLVTGTPVSAQTGITKVQIVSIDESPSMRWEALPVRLER